MTAGARAIWYDAGMRRDNVILVGFMGAGKSVCGRLLASRLGPARPQLDLGRGLGDLAQPAQRSPFRLDDQPGLLDVLALVLFLFIFFMIVRRVARQGRRYGLGVGPRRGPGPRRVSRPGVGRWSPVESSEASSLRVYRRSTELRV